MRNGLGKLKGKRTHFCGRFSRYGFRPILLPPVRTFALADIQNAEGILLADHLWFTVNSRFAALGELREGQLIEFDARVTEYERHQYLGPSERRKSQRDGGTDFRLSFPTNVRIVE